MLADSVFSFRLNMSLAKTFAYGETEVLCSPFPGFTGLEKLPGGTWKRSRVPSLFFFFFPITKIKENNSSHLCLFMNFRLMLGWHSQSGTVFLTHSGESQTVGLISLWIPSNSGENGQKAGAVTGKQASTWTGLAPHLSLWHASGSVSVAFFKLTCLGWFHALVTP